MVMIMNINELVEFIKKKGPEMSYYTEKITIQLEEDGYEIMFEKNPRFGYILGLPGSANFTAVTMESIKSLLDYEMEETFTKYFSLCAELNGETFNENNIFVTF